ncbi:glycogen debranching protein GlgX [Gleimia coleocanis]|nr:glycogen debranching protein GlgX [Gleimia coleocanis]
MAEKTWKPAEKTLPPATAGATFLGARVVEGGVDFCVTAPYASAVELCVFPTDAPLAPETRYQMNLHDGGCWSAFLPGAGVGTFYGYRVDGEWNPARGLSYNPFKLLLDPYGRGLAGTAQHHFAVFAHEVDPKTFEPAANPPRRCTMDSAPYQARSVVIDNHFPVAEHPRRSWNETVVYELHVKGYTKNLPGVPEELRGTYAGLAHPATIAHFKKLGITAIELLPIHAKWDEPFLVDKGLTNYWGYNTLSYFTPEPSYATAAAQAAGAQAILDEVRGMVSILHQNGIEVLLDVVYNHTCEGGTYGPAVSWRGFGQTMYYRHTNTHPRHMINDTGCGNTVNFDEARVIQMTLDSLRYWSEEIGVDGFRFDLAVTLGRFADGFTPKHPFFMAVAADPVLKQQKLIAEPWDIGPGGWQTGNFPLPWSEWNDRFRDTIRSFWLADFANLERGWNTQGPNDLATRISGSIDFFGETLGHWRRTRSSVNFVTAHDGFTLCDLTSFNHKMNHANLENNRDGSSENRSWNHGIEGLTATYSEENGHDIDDGLFDAIRFARFRSMRNIMATLMISAGTPMITAGDEFARTQNGNNNAYCQDSPISWVNWDLSDSQQHLLESVQYLIHLRAQHQVFRPVYFCNGLVAEGDVIPGLAWFTAAGQPMHDEFWHSSEHRLLQMLRSGKPHNDADLLVVFNATLNEGTVALPEGRGKHYRLVFDSSWRVPSEGGVSADFADLSGCEVFAPGDESQIEPQSLQIFLTVG